MVATVCNIRSSALARKSTLIASKPFLAMFIDCTCTSFVDKTTESLSTVYSTVSVNSEVSNEVEVPPGVLIRALGAAPVGPCYTNYLNWLQLLIRWSYKIIG